MSERTERPPVAAGVPKPLLRAGIAAACIVALAVVIWLFAEMVDRLTIVVVPLLLALLITAVFHPVVARLSHRRLPEWVLPLLVVLVLLGVLIGAVAVAGTRAASQVSQLREQAVELREQIIAQTGVNLPSVPGRSGQQGSGGNGDSSGSSGAAAAQALSIGTEILVSLFLTLALAFLFLKDGPDIWQWVLQRSGAGVRDRIDVAGRAAWGTLSTYVRGLTVVALFDAVGIALGLALLGVPLVLTLALLQFFGSYIPTFGAFIAGAVAVAVALVSGGAVTAALTLLLVVAVQQLGNDVIEPWIMGRTLPIHATVVLLAVTAGATLWGVAGALLFVPMTAAAVAAADALRTGQTRTATDTP